ncbi:hypothetical protein ACE01N_20290 [Saccharicrinis sp. FJH2]|uniref:hypothetical protein n=1 Tax=Saccharicrinis sp. FJH65 TaxID=3344659 RepID=UPI0035F34F10
MNKKFKTWSVIGLFFSIGLFFYAFTYWGNHGLGDSYRIPVGHRQVIYNGDGVWTYFKVEVQNKLQQKHINEFAIKNDKLCANIDGNKYLIFDLKTSKMTEFQNKNDYEIFALRNNLPTTSEFKDFISRYHDFWSGWRLYLLP